MRQAPGCPAVRLPATKSSFGSTNARSASVSSIAFAAGVYLPKTASTIDLRSAEFSEVSSARAARSSREPSTTSTADSNCSPVARSIAPCFASVAVAALSASRVAEPIFYAFALCSGFGRLEVGEEAVDDVV